MSTILVVDDTPEIRQMYRAVLRSCGHEIILAATGAEALMIMEVKFPDLILLDLAMPEMDGVEFLRIVRNTPEWASLPVMLMTAFVGEKQVDIARKLGATDHLVKGDFTVKMLRDRIARYLPPPSHAAVA